MTLKNYAVDKAIKVTYQTDGAKSGLVDVTIEIFDETGAKDPVDFPDIVMTEILTSGRYEGTFTPDAQGEWIIMISYGTGKGKLVKQYSVGGFNLDDVGQIANAIGIQTSGIDSPAMIG
ncbi:hypothetical protein LCGC14_0812540 [marine sediment metagenome]|uniref:YtkA-like domain-containing protein n=1 Tax=marine sediment metagenome TaxID=412755 RepID=A0A0F9PQT0_9ZZZZ